MRRRQSFTLLELIIAMGLAAMALSVLFFIYGEISTLAKFSQTTNQLQFQEMLLKTRLSDVLPRAKIAKKLQGYFFTLPEDASVGISESLVFYYENGVSKNKPFSNYVLGRLFVNDSKQLMLATWPTPVDWVEGYTPPIHLEVLAQNITEITFFFYVPPESNLKEFISEELPYPTVGWVNEWSKEHVAIPPIMKIQLRDDHGNVAILGFVLPNSPYLVVL